MSTQSAERQKLRAARRAKGLCTDCGSSKLYTTLKGKPGIRCEYCRHKQSERRPYRTRKDKNHTVEVDEAPSLVDTPEFKEYAARVLALVKERPGLTEPQIDRELQPPRNGHWTQCALIWQSDNLESIEKGFIKRYYAQKRRRAPEMLTTKYGITGKKGKRGEL